MSTKFLLATLIDGTTLVAQFEKLGGSGQGYAEQVLSGRKAFNAWRIVSTTNPANGEPAILRTRAMIAGHQIASIAQVKPKVEDHGYVPTNFEPVTELQKGEYGNWTAPTANAPQGIVAGAQYTVHRDLTDGRRYVIVAMAGEPETVGGEPTPEQRHYVDAAVGTVQMDRDEDRRGDSADDAFGHMDDDDDAPMGMGPRDGDDDL